MATPTVRELLRGTANNANITLTTGAGTAVGDVLVVFHAADGLTAADLVAPTGTAGTWTQQSLGDIGASNSRVKCWTRPVAAGGAQTVTATKVGTTDHGVHLYVLAGADTTSPTDGATGTSGAASTSHVAPSVSPATADALLLCAVVSEVFSFGNYTSVSGSMTDLTEDDLIPASTFATLASARQALAASGATGTRTFAYSQSKVFAAVSVAIKAAGGATTHAGAASGASTSTGSAAVTLRLAAAASGASTSAGSAAATVVPAGPVTHQAGASGASTSGGSAAPALRMTVAAAGVSASTGSAVPRWLLTAGASGLSVSSGSAAAEALGQVVTRPFTGTTARPGPGTTPRPFAGVTTRP